MGSPKLLKARLIAPLVLGSVLLPRAFLSPAFKHWHNPSPQEAQALIAVLVVACCVQALSIIRRPRHPDSGLTSR